MAPRPLLRPPHGAYDLQTTMLHEIIHGVGIISSIRADKSAMPLIYDLQLHDTNGQPVVTTSFTGAFGQSLHVNGVDVYNPPTYARLLLLTLHTPRHHGPLTTRLRMHSTRRQRRQTHAPSHRIRLSHIDAVTKLRHGAPHHPWHRWSYHPHRRHRRLRMPKRNAQGTRISTITMTYLYKCRTYNDTRDMPFSPVVRPS